ncbi:MAG TPA: hypothetical protein VKA85_01665 [Candidatus Limnocylindrales bacterium]|nr:hypothetical protein [Candidatus Limnocylindrales bacterium]
MTESERRLRREIDEITDHVSRLKAVVRRRMATRPGDPAALALADQAVAIAGDIVPKTATETKLVEEVLSD